MLAYFIEKSREKLISDTVWRKNNKSIRNYLNVGAAFVFLVQAEIVPRDSQEAYIDLRTEVDKRNCIIDSIPKCEQYDYLLRFIECLKNTYGEAGKAHEDLVKLLEEDYKEMKNDNTTCKSYIYKINFHTVLLAGKTFANEPNQQIKKLTLCDLRFYNIMSIQASVSTFLRVMISVISYIKSFPFIGIGDIVIIP